MRFLRKSAAPVEAVQRSDRLSRPAFIVGAIVFVACYAALLLANFSRSVGGSDSSGYLNAAWRLRHGGLVERIPAIDLLSLDYKFSPLFRPLGFTWGPKRGTQSPYYPLGMPLHQVLAAEVFGWDLGPYLISPVAAVIGVILIYLLARQFGLPRLFSTAGALILALAPAYLFIAVQSMSDVLATTWVMAAMLAALLARRRSGWAVLSGAAFGISVLVRPTDALFAIPLLLALPWKFKSFLLFGAGAFPFSAFWLAMNKAMFGGWIVSGYRDLFEKDMALSNFPLRFKHYGAWLIATLTPLVPLAWPAVPAVRRLAVKDRMIIIAWFLPLFVFYCFYGPHDAWWYLRFLLPGMPALILAALLTAQSLLERTPRRTDQPGNAPRWGLAAAVLCLVLVVVNEAWMIGKLDVLKIRDQENIYRQSCEWAERNWPEKSVVLSMQTSGALEFYTKFIPCRWDVIQPGQFEVLRARAEERGYKLFAMLFPFEEKDFQKKVPGRWIKSGNIRHLSLWRLLPD